MNSSLNLLGVYLLIHAGINSWWWKGRLLLAKEDTGGAILVDIACPFIFERGIDWHRYFSVLESLHIVSRRIYFKNDANRSKFSVYYFNVGYVRVPLSIYRYQTNNRMLDIINHLIFCRSVPVTMWCDKTCPVWKWQDTLSKTYSKVTIHASICPSVNQESSPANHSGGLYNKFFSLLVHLTSVIFMLAIMNYSAYLHSFDVWFCTYTMRSHT